MAAEPRAGANGREAMPVLLSVHDVMPEQLQRVGAILDRLESRALHATLLVVPGKPWRDCDIDCLRAWAARGHRLAAHGWTHRARRVRGLRHRLHAQLISRDAAEHLALSRRELQALLQRSHDWFGEHELSPPSMYVPPAWAMGALGRRDLSKAPFRLYECLSGVIHARSGRLLHLPLIGFEADTTARAASLTLWNRTQHIAARRWQRPLRISIHPRDPELRLAPSLRQTLAQACSPMFYDALMDQSR